MKKLNAIIAATMIGSLILSASVFAIGEMGGKAAPTTKTVTVPSAGVLNPPPKGKRYKYSMKNQKIVAVKIKNISSNLRPVVQGAIAQAKLTKTYGIPVRQLNRGLTVIFYNAKAPLGKRYTSLTFNPKGAVTKVVKYVVSSTSG